MAIEDYSTAIDLNSDYAPAYKNRGIALINQYFLENDKQPTIDDVEDACEDFAQAFQLGDESAKPYLFKYCIDE